MELKGNFLEVFSVGLGKCTKIKAKFELKENIRPIFRKKRNVPFTATEEINKELDRLVNMGILSKVEFSEWAAPMTYIRKNLLTTTSVDHNDWKGNFVQRIFVVLVLKINVKKEI